MNFSLITREERYRGRAFSKQTLNQLPKKRPTRRYEGLPPKHVPVPLFEIDDRTGVVTNAVSFECGSRRFIAHRPSKYAVIHYRPYFKVDETDESSCSCLLLMYIPWPNGLEEELIDEG
jgi:hypothetical protein